MIEHCPFPQPTAETVCSMPGLLYFIWEREAIRLAKENGHPAPWTADPVLAKYKFTNIRRRDDRGSQWVIKHLIQPNENRLDLWFTLLVARLVNWPPTLQALLRAGVLPCSPAGFDAARFEAVLEGLRASGAKVYSGAYMLYPTKNPGVNKAHTVAKYIIGSVVQHSPNIHNELWRDDLEPGGSIERFVAALSECFGISTFMAGQVAADLTYGSGLNEASDIYSYAPMGPGSQRGLNYLQGRAPFATWKSGMFTLTLQGINEAVARELDITDLTLHDVQNCMCEYSKYCRSVLGEGKPKNTYIPEKEF
jgi:hypothetical protein